MNDPNGMFLDAQGTYHLYYQYNPISTVAGNQVSSHASVKIPMITIRHVQLVRHTAQALPLVALVSRCFSRPSRAAILIVWAAELGTCYLNRSLPLDKSAYGNSTN